MSVHSTVLTARVARRLPDPVFDDITRHVMLVNTRDVPKDLPTDSNARIPNVRKRVYRDVEKSLLNDDETEPGSFHLKHKGITMLAESVEAMKDNPNAFSIAFEPGQGIVDGGHTYELISRHVEAGDLPDNQFVKFEILTHVPPDWIPTIAGGLNTSVQVQPASLDNLAGMFNWIKAAIDGQIYADKIAWKENEAGDMDGRDIVSILTCFNIDLFPNTKDEQPVMAYEKKSKALELFESNEPSYRKLQPILTNILTLHDVIRKDSGAHWNEQGGKFGKLAFVESHERGKGFEFPFTGEYGKYRLMNGALYPMLASFRWMVEEDPKTGTFKWRGGFPAVLKRWTDSAAELMKATATASTELGRNPNAIGKSRNHWANLHARIAMRDLIATQSKSK